MLLALAQTEGPDVVHLAYSQGFEALCSRIKSSPKTQDKHPIWEQLLELQSSDIPESSSHVQSREPLLASRSVAPAPAGQRLPPRVESPPSERGMLFHIESPIPEQQPWATPPE